MNPYAQRDAEYFAEEARRDSYDQFCEEYVTRRYAEIMASPELIFDAMQYCAETLTVEEITAALEQTATQQYRLIDRNVRREVEREADAAANNRNYKEQE